MRFNFLACPSPRLRLSPLTVALAGLVAASACRPSDGGGPSDDPADDPVVTDPSDDPLDPPAPPAAVCVGPAAGAPQADLGAAGARVVDSYNTFFGERLSRDLEAALPAVAAGDPARIDLLLQLGAEHLKLGRTADAVAGLEEALAAATAAGSPRERRIREVLAVANIRLAELNNCLNGDHATACIIPFDPTAIHADPAGMQAAIVQLEWLTTDDPDDLRSRWLLNLAHMAINTWPDGITPEQQMGPEVFASEASVPTWRNLAPELDLVRRVPAGAGLIDDLDGDGALDMILGSFDLQESPSHWHNNGDGSFCEATNGSGLSAQPGIMGLTQADYDNDGDLDLYVARGAWQGAEGAVRGSLLANHGDGTFEDVTVGAGLAALVGPSQVGVWGDFDLDGWIDLFVTREQDDYTTRHTAPCSLYHNNGDGTFEDLAPALGMADLGLIKGAAWGDYDNDGDPDLYVSQYRGPNYLFRNDTTADGARFVDVTDELGVAGPIASFPTWFFDYDQDGWLDLFVASFDSQLGVDVLRDGYGSGVGAVVADMLGLPTSADRTRLYHNVGGRFVDVSEEAGVSHVWMVMGSNYGDFDADGWPDLYLGTGSPPFDALSPNIALLNDRGGHFLDVTAASGLGHLQKGHGVGFGDLDEDGDEDILAMVGGAVRGDGFGSALFENPAESHSVTLRLEGTTSNRSAIGARVRVVTAERTSHHLVGSGGSFGASSLQVEAGLGAATEVQRVEIAWPGGDVEVVEDLRAGEIVTIRQGEGVVARRDLKPAVLRPQMGWPG